MKYIICDIDGTIANLDHRLHFIQGKKKDYDAFYDACIDDAGIMPVATILSNMLDGKNIDIIFVSGRSDRVMTETKQWLGSMGFVGKKLYMRPHGDNIQDTELKKRIYEEHLKDLDIFCVFDDRPRVVQMRRDLGLFVFDVNHRGEF